MQDRVSLKVALRRGYLIVKERAIFYLSANCSLFSDRRSTRFDMGGRRSQKTPDGVNIQLARFNVRSNLLQ